jgi:NAD(P)-dependent dehydrogenase (short-subunit alcohol dehydrogenase family)
MDGKRSSSETDLEEPPQKRRKLAPCAEAEKYLHSFAKDHGNNVISRGLQTSCVALDNFDRATVPNKDRPRLPKGLYRKCYGCGVVCKSLHSNYLLSCYKCGVLFEKYRHFSVRQDGKVALVIGARAKLGHQVVLKLLRAGAVVIGTSRRPEEALKLYDGYYDREKWTSRLHIYPTSLDLDRSNLSERVDELCKWIEKGYGHLDILINSAAQTIRSREKNPNQSPEKNRYGDAKFSSTEVQNSWQLTIDQITQQESEEVYRINAVAPLIIAQRCIPLMQLSPHTPYIINVHAKEGLFSVEKSPNHIHTNMAKAGLAMLTKCLSALRLRTKDGKKFSINGCDPGWISVDEYYENDRPFIVAPLDEVDGAARILYPLFTGLKGNGRTRRHFGRLCY